MNPILNMIALWFVFLFVWVSNSYLFPKFSFSSSYKISYTQQLKPTILYSASTSSIPTNISPYTLDNIHLVENILRKDDRLSESPEIQGTYAIEDDKGEVQYIGCSTDILQDVRLFQSRHGLNIVHSIRIQSMNDQTMMKAYTDELIRQMNFQQNNLDWNIHSSQSSSKSKVNSKLESLKSKIQSMKAQGMVEDNIISPFENRDLKPTTTTTTTTIISTNTNENDELKFTFENVDKVLNEIRPYLIADGGNVTILTVDEKLFTIQLQLQGACGGCPSSTTTMKMGIERILKENFPYVKNIEAINPIVEAKLTVEMVDKALDPVKPSISAMKGELQIKSVNSENGSVVIAFRGPSRLKQGLELILKDVKFVKKVEFEEIL